MRVFRTKHTKATPVGRGSGVDIIRNSLLSLMLACALALPLLPCPARADDYHLGEGYNLGRMNISGYSNLTLNAPTGDRTAVMLDDLSVFLSGHFHRFFNPFVEFELTGAPIFVEGKGFFNSGQPQVVLERAYNDFHVDPDWSLRVGKMLSPVGEWNLIHAAPLVWTTNRPLTTYYNFAEYASGVSVLYSDTAGLLPDLQLYYQPGDDFVRAPRNVKPFRWRKVGGLNLAFTSDISKRLGFSMQYAQSSDSGVEQWLAGMDGRIKFGRLTLESQWTHAWLGREQIGKEPAQFGSLQRRNEWGGYVQAIYGLSEQYSLVSRGELFQSRYQRDPSSNWLVGLVYRPLPAISWKLEYLDTAGPQLDLSRGIYASMAVLF